jgi:ABC-type branched-subunit amino acid transport system ATPase component/ABC-type branched-subunit amino acid transport system permease subunit
MSHQDTETQALLKQSVPRRHFWQSFGFYGFIIVMAAAIALPSILEPYRLFLATLVCIYVVIVIGLNVVMGYSGQISIAQAAFMGVGAYTTAILMDRFGVHLLLALLVSVVFTTVLGFVVGLPALRIAGHYLALATLAFQLIIENIIFSWDSVTNGPRGIPVPDVELFGFNMRDAPLYFLTLFFAVVVFLFVRNLVLSRTGRSWRALRDQSLAAVVFGIGPARYKTMAFATSAALAGLGGGLFAITVGYLDPLAFNLWESVKQLTMVLFGGLGTLYGPVLGATLLEVLPSLLTGFEEHSLLIFFIILLLVILFFPGGLAEGFRRLSVRIAILTGKVRGQGVLPEIDPESPRISVAMPDVVGQSSVEVGEPLLVAKDISVHFGGLVALDGVDLTIKRGEIKGLIGPNGAGKTTLFNVITRVYDQTSGTVTFDGTDLATEKRQDLAGLGMARTFQNVAMFTSMTVLENVMVGAHHRGKAGFWRTGIRTIGSVREERRTREEAMEILAFLNLHQYANTLANVLPIGLQRRVEVARAMSVHPSLLLLDEPASGLTSQEAGQLMDDIETFRDAGVTVLVIEHNMRFVMGLVESITVLDHGRVIFEGSPQEAQLDAEVIRAYLGTDDDESQIGEIHD